MFHRHKFEETGREFNEPVAKVAEVRGYQDDSTLMLSVGFTNVTRECSCGEVRVQRHLGRLTDVRG